MAGSLEFIKSETITTSVSSVDVTNCFSADYDVYKIVFSGLKTAGTGAVRNRLRVIKNDDVVQSTLSYANAYLQLKANTTFGEGRNTNDSYVTTPNVTDNPDSGNTVMYVYNPYDSSSYTFFQYQAGSYFNGNLEGLKAIAVYTPANIITGFQYLETTGTAPFDTGTISVYGVK